jgi:(E)-4-hydroxy-3-methylbut-2-enyl-diphosphate synthase
LNSFFDLYLSQHPIRFRTREISIGGIILGGNNPIRIQSMTNTDTNNIASTVAQCIELADTGCEMVRITAQGEREALNLKLIKEQLRIKGYHIPLIADIHFNPKAAEIAAGIVDKVRINPGNYIDKRAMHNSSFSQAEYELELERIAERIDPLLNICKQNGTAIRIGTNHGSLSQRIIDRYGDTPEGMVESALEFARICDAAGFRNLVLSMKSSNVRIMVQATRLLVHRMIQEKLDFPLHLGVTEAGDGEDGTLKSAAGIGALLEDGIGDTIRVSLTGDPVREIPVALEIARRYNRRCEAEDGKQKTVSGSQRLVVEETETGATREYSLLGKNKLDPFSYHKVQSLSIGPLGGSQPVQVVDEELGTARLIDETGSVSGVLIKETLDKISVMQGSAREMRSKALFMVSDNDLRPKLITKNYSTNNLLNFQVNSAIDFGTLLIDGIGDAISLKAPNFGKETINQTAFGILQATRTRITRIEFISCPSCGRTLFDIESTLTKVKAATGHLNGLKIAVMGCIVNGPGEMADADYGYVGAGKGRITLYKGTAVIRRNIPEEEALSALIELIRQSGDWKEPDS